MSLTGLTKQEFDETYLSVGSHKNVRPLSPIEVALNCRKAQEAGASTKEIATALGLKGPDMVRRFLKTLDLDKAILHLVDWGESSFSVVSFSATSEVAQLPTQCHIQIVDAICKYGLTKNEMISVRQLHDRSRRSIQDCVSDVTSRRTKTIIREIVVGALTNPSIVSKLQNMHQTQRDTLLHEVIEDLYPDVNTFTSKLGANRYTIIGGKDVGRHIATDIDFESRIAKSLLKKIDEPL